MTGKTYNSVKAANIGGTTLVMALKARVTHLNPQDEQRYPKK